MVMQDRKKHWQMNDSRQRTFSLAAMVILKTWSKNNSQDALCRFCLGVFVITAVLSDEFF